MSIWSRWDNRFKKTRDQCRYIRCAHVMRTSRKFPGTTSETGPETRAALCRILYIPLCIVYAARYTVSGVVTRYRAYAYVMNICKRIYRYLLIRSIPSYYYVCRCHRMLQNVVVLYSLYVRMNKISS